MGFLYVSTMPCPSSEARVVLTKEVVFTLEGFPYVRTMPYPSSVNLLLFLKWAPFRKSAPRAGVWGVARGRHIPLERSAAKKELMELKKLHLL